MVQPHTGGLPIVDALAERTEYFDPSRLRREGDGTRQNSIVDAGLYEVAGLFVGRLALGDGHEAEADVASVADFLKGVQKRYYKNPVWLDTSDPHDVELIYQGRLEGLLLVVEAARDYFVRKRETERRKAIADSLRPAVHAVAAGNDGYFGSRGIVDYLKAGANEPSEPGEDEADHPFDDTETHVTWVIGDMLADGSAEVHDLGDPGRVFRLRPQSAGEAKED